MSVAYAYAGPCWPDGQTDMTALYVFAIIGCGIVVAGMFALGMLVRSINNKPDEE